MALNDITNSFETVGSYKEYKFQPASSVIGVQLSFQEEGVAKVVIYQSLDGESWVPFEIDYGVGKTYQKNIEGILTGQYIRIQLNLSPVKALILE